MVRRSALSLQLVQPWDEPKFAFRFSPLSIPPPETRHGAALQTGQHLLPDLPGPPRPELEALDSLLNPLPPTNAWRAAWVLEKGWMLCEADRWEEAGRTIRSRADSLCRLAEQAQAIIEAGKDREGTVLRAALLRELAGHYQLEIAEEEQKWDQVLAACDHLTAMVVRDPRASGLSRRIRQSGQAFRPSRD